MTANASNTNADQLKTWTCLKCGAPLPKEISPGASVTCTYCGTPFKLPTATPRSGGVDIITTGEGAITIGGNVVGGDLVLSSAGTPQPGTASGSGAGVTLSSPDIEIRGTIVDGDLRMPAQATPPSNEQGTLSRFLNHFRKK